MSARREDWGDVALRLAARAPSRVGLWAARRAAARGLSTPALRRGARDPLVLARLGLHLDARASRGGGRAGDFARAVSSAALGNPGPARRLVAADRRLSVEDRRLLARGLAASDPAFAARVLPPTDSTARAACAVASGDLEIAASWLRGAPFDREASLVRAALAARIGDWRLARHWLNRAFTIDDCAAPLDDAKAEPPALASFGEIIGSPRVVDGPMISVVMPALNAEATLAVAVGSLLRQTWRNLDVLIVDDGSRDATGGIAARLARTDPRVRAILNTGPPGAYGARNSGVAAARGAFIAFHDADDWAHPERLERQMGAIGPRESASIARYFRLDDAGVPVSPRVFPLIRLSPMAVVARIEVWRKVGPFEAAPLGADSEWLARLEEQLGRRSVARTAAIGFVARWAPGSLSASPASGMSGEGLERRLTYERAWRRRHAGLA